MGILTGIVASVARRLVGSLAGGLLDRLGGIVGRWADREVVIAKAEIEAEVEARKAARDVLVAEQGRWYTALCRPFVFYPFALHAVAVVLDSVIAPYGTWGVPSLPSPYAEMQWTIIMSYFLTRPFEKRARAGLVLGRR